MPNRMVAAGFMPAYPRKQGDSIVLETVAAGFMPACLQAIPKHYGTQA